MFDWVKNECYWLLLLFRFFFDFSFNWLWFNHRLSDFLFLLNRFLFNDFSLRNLLLNLNNLQLLNRFRLIILDLFWFCDLFNILLRLYYLLWFLFSLNLNFLLWLFFLLLNFFWLFQHNRYLNRDLFFLFFNSLFLLSLLLWLFNLDNLLFLLFFHI